MMVETYASWKLLLPVIYQVNFSFVEERVTVLMDEKPNNYNRWILLLAQYFYWTMQVITSKSHAYPTCYLWMVFQVLWTHGCQEFSLTSLFMLASWAVIGTPNHLR
jgi:hypothetical protein